MGRPTTMSAWWKALLDTRAEGSIQLLAKLLEVNVRTLHRWQGNVIRVPGLVHRNRIRAIAGKDLLEREDVPRYLKYKPKPIPRGRHAANRTNS